MFESMTAEYLLTRMLGRVSDSLDKREGSVIWDTLMPCAIELETAYHQLDMVLDEVFADTASMEYLIRRAAERGLLPKAATYAHLKAAFYGTAQIPVGNRYNCGLYNYQVEKRLDEPLEGGGYYEVICESLGSGPNGNLGFLYPVGTEDYVDGFESAKLVSVIIPGEDDEDQELYRERYFASFEAVSFGGNVAEYKEWVNALDGVGGVKVYPIWNGPGTVKVEVITSTYQAPEAEFVTRLQEQIDPGLTGLGKGIAPIGHTVTVTGVKAREISIAVKLTLSQGTVFEGIRAEAEEAVDQYFTELARDWADSERLVVRSSQIEVRFLNLSGVLDVEGLTLDGKAGNLELSGNQIPKRGALTSG